VLNVGNVRVPVGLLAQPPGGFPIVLKTFPPVENKPMAKFLSWLPSILSAIVWLIGQIQAAQSQVMQAAGTFSSPEAATDSISFWSNVEAGGMVATGVTAAIAWAINKFWGKLSKGKLQPHVQYQAAMGCKATLTKYLDGDAAAVATLNSLAEPIRTKFAAALEAGEKPSPTPIAVVVK
jgi:hypothetical protein